MEDATSGFNMSGGATMADYGLKKGPWLPEEDALLIKYVKKNGEGNWKNVQKTGLMRCGKSCRLRWTNHLKPDLKKGPFSLQEEKTVIELHQKFGNKWSKIASKLPGRTDNEVKNFWNTKIKKRIMKKSQKVIGESSSSTQQSGVEETSSNLPSMNSTHVPFMKGEVITPMTNSKAHQGPIISFPKYSAFLINFSVQKGGQTNHISPSTSVLQNPFSMNKPKAYPYPGGAHVLEFTTGSTYYNPNPFPSSQTHTYLAKARPNANASVWDGGMWVNGSLTYDPSMKLEFQEQDPQNEEATSIWSEPKNNAEGMYTGSNYSYGELSSMEINPKIVNEANEVEEMECMDEELSNLINIFSFDESPPEMDMKKIKAENVTTGFRTHFYLDQKLAFPSFSGTNSDAPPCPESSEIDDECFDIEDWINGTEC